MYSEASGKRISRLIFSLKVAGSKVSLLGLERLDSELPSPQNRVDEAVSRIQSWPVVC